MDHIGSIYLFRSDNPAININKLYYSTQDTYLNLQIVTKLLYKLIDENIFIKYESDIFLLLSFYILIGYKHYFPISELKSANICFIYYGELFFNIIYCNYLYCSLIGYKLSFRIIELKSANICFIYYGELLFNIIYCKHLYYELKLTTFYESYIIHIYFSKDIHYFQNIEFNTSYYLSKMHTQLTYLFKLLFSYDVGRQ